MDPSSAPQQRDMVYCHRCENEWYRDEHGLVCPECESEFTEIIEANHDPRAGDSPMPSLEEMGSDQRDYYAPDPDDEDISGWEWPDNGPGQAPGQHLHGTSTRSFGPGGSQDEHPLGPGQPGRLINMLASIFGNAQQQQQQQQQQQPPQQEQQGWRNPPPQQYRQQQQQEQQGGQQQQQQGQRPWLYGGEGFRSTQGSPSPDGNVIIRHTSGPGYSITFTSSTNTNLHPRNANSPQPFQHHPDNIEQLLGQMFMNIGALQGRGGVHVNGNGGVHVQGNGGVHIMGGAQRGFGGARAGPGERGFPFGDLLSFLMPPGGVHGDAVYSQDALDRVITQLMEQHQTGNAPGPATDDAISALPTRPIVAADQGDNGKAECSICMDEAELGATVTTLPCDHWFHHECIKAWLSEHDTCPHCRRGIMPKDEPNTNRPRQPSQAPLYDMHSPEYHLPRTPGEFPFGQQDAGEGSATAFTSARSPSASGSGSGSGAGMFSRMREAFGGAGSGSGSNTRRGSDNNRPR